MAQFALAIIWAANPYRSMPQVGEVVLFRPKVERKLKHSKASKKKCQKCQNAKCQNLTYYKH